MNGILNFIKENFELLLLADIIIFQIVIICGISSIESLLKDHLNYISDRVGSISQCVYRLVDINGDMRSRQSRIERSLIKKKRVDSFTYWVDGKAYWLDEEHELHPLEEPED